MRILLGLFIASITCFHTGHTEKVINGHLEESILLPCTCLNRAVDQTVIWQMKRIQKTFKVFKYEKNTSTFFGQYKDRAKVQLTENDCSLLLSNITQDDQGHYKCNYYNPLYSYEDITLNVSARYTVCQMPGPGNHLKGTNGGIRDFQCNATGRFPGDQIHWVFDGQPLEKYSVKNWNLQNTSTGFNLSSTLNIRLNGTSAPLCVVKNPDMSINISYSCSEDIGPPGRMNKANSDSSPITHQHPSVSIICSSTITVVISLLAVFLVLYRCQISNRDREQRTNSEMTELNQSEHSNCTTLILVTTEQ
ncbi:uncharacterized protein ACJ7VT_014260 [Polymixia lowei]